MQRLTEFFRETTRVRVVLLESPQRFLPQRPSAANSYYSPLAVRVHPPVPTPGVLHGGVTRFVLYFLYFPDVIFKCLNS